MELAALIRPELILSDLPGSDRRGVLRSLARLAVENGIASDVDTLYEKLREREELASTGIGSGVAIPHCKLKRVDKVFVAVGRHAEGIDFDAMDGEPVQLFFLVISPVKSPALHLHCLASISKWVQAENHVQRMLELGDPVAMYQLLQQG